MAINISITGLTTQQQQDVGNAFDQTIQGRGPLTKAQWVERCLLRYIKGIVMNTKRQTRDATLVADQAQVDLDYPEA